VIGDLRAICERPAKAAIEEFKAALQRYGQAKLKLRTRIIEDGNTAVDVQAAYVSSRGKPRPTGSALLTYQFDCWGVLFCSLCNNCYTKLQTRLK